MFTGNIFSGGVATGDIGSGSNEYARQELSLTEQYALGTPKSLETLDEKEREPTSIDVKNMARITEKKQLQQVIIDIAPEDIFDTIDNLTIIQEKVLSQ